MLEKDILQRLLNEAMTTGADFAEIYLEDTKSSMIRVMNGDVTSIDRGNVFGAGIRLILGLDEVYGYTNQISEDAILTIIKNLRASFHSTPIQAKPLGAKKPFQYLIKKPMHKVPVKVKTDQLQELSKIMSAKDKRIVQAVAVLVENEQNVLIANSDGIYQDDIRTYTRLTLMSAAEENGLMQQAYESPGRHMGYELLDEIDFKTLADEVATSAITLLSAEEMTPQVMPVVLHNGFGGVIFHEACGHPLEATAVAKGLSPFANKLGERIGSDKVTAYDEGDLDGEWGSLNFDDEGMKTQKNLLIENGILKGYLIDYRNARKMKMDPTGSGRRQSYKFSPTSRMNSTYIAKGTDKFEDIIKDTKYGLFAKKLGGGTVVPATGEFNFAVQEGYMIEDGRITKPVRGAMLIGHGKDILFKIDRVSDNLSFGQGMCGSISGSIPVDVGQPSIRVSEMTVGGSGGKK
ncbi:MAG: peptidase C69 [Tenericutes bacterium HGW-Tenericutes-2]|jgi:TldD protein|nr:MAG: peptidase C69 [Tenericutes bacterium HGW-Tenericutes-2]